jgi:phenylacetate-CoA ligase
LPLLASVEGRMLDMIVGADGQVVAGEYFVRLLRDEPTVRRFQVHQDRSKAITVNIIPAKDYRDENARRIERGLREFLGEQSVIRIRVVDDIPPTRSGKHRVTISEVPNEFGARMDPPQAASAGIGLETL